MGGLDVYITEPADVTPVVGLVKPPLSLTLDTFEVTEAFEIPLSFFLDETNHRPETRKFNGADRHFYAVYMAALYLGSDGNVHQSVRGSDRPRPQAAPAALNNRTSSMIRVVANRRPLVLRRRFLACATFLRRKDGRRDRHPETLVSTCRRRLGAGCDLARRDRRGNRRQARRTICRAETGGRKDRPRPYIRDKEPGAWGR